MMNHMIKIQPHILWVAVLCLAFFPMTGFAQDNTLPEVLEMIQQYEEEERFEDVSFEEQEEAFEKISSANTVSSFAQSDVKISQRSPVIDVLDLKNMDVHDVLKLISKKSGINIVAGQNVKGKVTVYLKNVTVQEALGIIVDANGWAYVQEGDIIKVMTAEKYESRFGNKYGAVMETKMIKLDYVKTPEVVNVLTQVKSQSGKILGDESSGVIILIDLPQKIPELEKIVYQMDVPVKTEIYDLSYANANDLSTKINDELTPNLGTMKTDERSNKVVVSDTKRKLSKIKEIIHAFDEQDKEVLIEAKIVQVVLSDEYKLGVDWEAVVKDVHELNFKSNFDILTSTEKFGKMTIGTLATDDYTFLIEALNTVGFTNILSSPRITTINNNEAKILVGSTEPYVTTTTTIPASGPSTTAESIEFIEVGVKLFVTPTIHNDGFITMKVKPEVSSVVDTVETSSNNIIPVVETSEAETTVMVKDGVTVVIGGLIKEENISTTKKVPLLGSIPLVGMAFKSESEKKEKTEIVIFLTPRIVTGDVPYQG